jgi:c-di-GMP-binding flagellar brake protein YcgR
MMREKRAHARTKKYFAINIISVEKGKRAARFDRIKANPKFCDESGLEFSPAGLKIMCSKPLPPESKIQMKLLIPEEGVLNLIRASGTIKWFRQVKGRNKKYFLIGVQFKELRPEDKEKIFRLWRKYKE